MVDSLHFGQVFFVFVLVNTQQHTLEQTLNIACCVHVCRQASCVRSTLSKTIEKGIHLDFFQRSSQKSVALKLEEVRKGNLVNDTSYCRLCSNDLQD